MACAFCGEMPCRSCGTYHRSAAIVRASLDAGRVFDSEADALAAFYAAEEALLAGGDA